MNRIEWKNVKRDTCGNSRYVCHYSNLLTTAEKAKNYLTFNGLYDIAVKRAKKIGGRKFHNKQYGGGIVFQTSNPAGEIEPLIAEIRGEPFESENPLVGLYKVDMNDEQLQKIGEALIELFGLKRLGDFEPVRVELKNGYGTKTAVGVAATALRVMSEACEVK